MITFDYTLRHKVNKACNQVVFNFFGLHKHTDLSYQISQETASETLLRMFYMYRHYHPRIADVDAPNYIYLVCLHYFLIVYKKMLKEDSLKVELTDQYIDDFDVEYRYDNRQMLKKIEKILKYNIYITELQVKLFTHCYIDDKVLKDFKSDKSLSYLKKEKVKLNNIIKGEFKKNIIIC